MKIILKFKLTSIGDVYDIIEENIGPWDEMYQSDIDKTFDNVGEYIADSDTLFVQYNTETFKFKLMKLEEIEKRGVKI